MIVVVFENRSLDNLLGRLYGPEHGRTLRWRAAPATADRAPNGGSACVLRAPHPSLNVVATVDVTCCRLVAALRLMAIEPGASGVCGHASSISGVVLRLAELAGADRQDGQAKARRRFYSAGGSAQLPR